MDEDLFGGSYGSGLKMNSNGFNMKMNPKVGFSLPTFGGDTSVTSGMYDLNPGNNGFQGINYEPLSYAPVNNPSSGGFGGIGNYLKDSGFLSTKDQQGWGSLALGAIQGGLGAFIGMKQYGLAKKQFEFQKDAWNKEYEVNKNLTNERLETRQNRRIADSGVTGMKFDDTASYMSKYGVK